MNMGSFRDFWDLVVDVWQDGVFGIQIADSLVALAIIAVFLLARNLITRIVLNALQRATQRTRTGLDERVLAALRDPIRFVPVVMGVFFATNSLDVGEDTEAFFYNVNRSLVAFTLFWALYRLTEPVGQLLRMAGGFLTDAMVGWIVKAARALFVVLGAATVLELWGIAVGPIIAGLGLFGVAVALGAQDLFKNLIAGLFVIGERRFNVGEWIQADGVVEGTVMEIGFRTTTVRRFDRAPVYVPNSKLSDNAVTNFTRMSHRRIRWIIGVEYRTSIEQLRQIRDGIERYILDSDDFADPSEVSTFVRIDAFSDSSIDLLLYCFTRTTLWGDWLEIKERLAYEVKRIVSEAGTGFAFPSRSLYLETLPDAPEVFPLQQRGEEARMPPPTQESTMPSIDRPFRPVDLADALLEAFDLEDLVARLVQEPQYRDEGLAAITLVRDAQLSIVLVAVRAGGELREHRAPASAMVTLLRGRAALCWDGGAKRSELAPGTLVAFASGLDHSLAAHEDSACLLVIGGRAGGE